MKIFISWSGERSRYIAETLRNWIPKVIQAAQPWMSGEDIDSGSRWSSDVMQELEASKFGIICITPENQTNPWIMFEAGALSKTLEQTFMVPILFEMNASDLVNPLSQFQARGLDKEGVFKVVKTINNAIGKTINESELEEIFEVWWPKLNSSLETVPKIDQEVKNIRSTDDYLRELIDNTREQLRREELRLLKSQEGDNKLDKLIRLLSGSLKDIDKKTSNIDNIISNDEFLKLSNFLKNKDLSKLSELTSNIEIGNQQNMAEMLSILEDTMNSNKSFTKEILQSNSDQQGKE